MSSVSIIRVKANFISIFCEALLHGAYTILAGGTLYVLLRKRRERRLQRSSLFMIVTTVLMYCMATAQIALVFHGDLIAFFDQHAIEGGATIFNDQGNWLEWTQNMIQVLNVSICMSFSDSLMGDLVVAWRTWVLCGSNNYVLIFPVICIAGGFVAGTGMVVALSKSPSGQDVFSGATVMWFGAFGALSCLANIYAVVLMSWKAWEHARFMQRMNCPAAMGRSTATILLIIESGFVYCVAVIITIILFVVNSTGLYIMTNMLSVITGIYPTIIIVLVCLKFTYADGINRAETFASRSVGGSHSGETKRRGEIVFCPCVREPGAGKAMSAQESHVECDPYELQVVELDAVGQNGNEMSGTKGDMRLRCGPMYGGIGVDSIHAAGEEYLLEELEDKRQLPGLKERIAHAV